MRRNRPLVFVYTGNCTEKKSLGLVAKKRSNGKILLKNGILRGMGRKEGKC